MAFSRRGEGAAESPALGPVRDPGPAEPAAEPGLGALRPAALRPGGAPGTPGWAFKEEGLRNRNAGLGETEKPELSRCHNRQGGGEAAGPLAFLAGVGLGPGKGGLDFIELQAARNLTICDVRSEVSCQEEDRSRDLLLGLQLGSREAHAIPQTPVPTPRRVCGSCVA